MLFFLQDGETAKKYATKLVLDLRCQGLNVETDHMDRGLKAQMKYANKIGAKYSVILGDSEIESGRVELKEMATSEKTEIALDVPAYINADGYTMLPVRAVATALGINNNNVIWAPAAKQVTILYGQRIITMTAGEAMVYVNGSAIPASAAVEIVDGRAFLALRDLANALGVTEIGWDAATSTATLN